VAINLPVGNGVFSEAVRSVHRRGFYDDVCPIIKQQPMLVAQYGRLVEEMTELDMALSRDPVSRVAEELADVAIVLAQLFFLTDFPLANMYTIGTNDGIEAEIGELWRWLRHWDGIDWGHVHVQLRIVACAINTLAHNLNIDLESAVADKLLADEKRGRLHAGAPT
jgi:NTP pyrophosphatase (non-canonical NTP hydrolase)